MKALTAISLAAVFTIVGSCLAAQEAKPRVIEWRQFPVPAGTPETPRPPDSEFLKVLPSLRPEPKPSEAAQSVGFTTWWADHGSQVFSEQPPSRGDMTRKAIVRTPAGEDEPLVLGLWGIRDVGPVTLTVTNNAFPVTIRRVEFRPRPIPADYFGDHVQGGRTVGLAAYLLPESTADVKGKANTVFWMTVQVPIGAPAARYVAFVEISVKDSSKIVRLPITIEVLRYKLPKADIAYGMYFRPFEQTLVDGRTAMRPQDKTPEMLLTYWRDMARHGMTSAAVVNIGPKFKDASGDIKVEGHATIKLIKDMMREGLASPDVPVMYLDTSSIPLGDPDAAANIKAQAKKLGLPELLYYGRDEPSVNEQELANFKNIQPLRKIFRIVSAMSDASASAYADFNDVLLVNGGRITPDVQKLARAKNVEMWTYDCSHRGAGNAPWSRYYAGLYMWALKLRGNFLWCYTEYFYREGGVDHPWAPTFCYVLPSDQGLLPSIEWEARREGVEDYRTLTYLESLIAKHPSSAVAREARAWLQGIRGRTDWYLARKMPPSMYPWDGPELYPMCPNFQPWELSAIRGKAQGFIGRKW